MGLLEAEGEGLPRPPQREVGEEGEHTSVESVAAMGGPVPEVAATGELLGMSDGVQICRLGGLHSQGGAGVVAGPHGNRDPAAGAAELALVVGEEEGPHWKHW